MDAADAHQSRVTAKVIDALYVEAMVLADDARAYFDTFSREERDALGPVLRVALPRKGLRAAVMFRAVRLVETGWAAIKQFRNRGQNDNGAIKDDHEL